MQTTRDRDSRAHVRVKVRELLLRQLRNRVNGSARLTDDDVVDTQPRSQLLGFARCRAVAYRDTADSVLFAELRKAVGGAVFLMQIHHIGSQNSALRVDYADLTAVRIARIKTHYHLVGHYRLHEKRFQIYLEIAYRAVLSLLGE